MSRPQEPLDDAALRALYARAQTTISSATTARLHRVRYAATQTDVPRRRRRLPLATGLAAVFALAIGVRVLLPGNPPDAAQPQPLPMPALAAADSATRLDDGLDEVLAGYEESPDFYRWLAANETTLIALE